MLGSRTRVLAELALVAALAVCAAWVIGRSPAKQAGDEANWVGTARFFNVLFLHGDISAEPWADSHWTRTQPMIPRYILGGWLTARGYQYEHLDPYFDHRRKWHSNVADGKAPDQATLTEARLPMRGLAAVSALLLYGAVRVLAGPLGGAAAALLFIGSPYLKLHLARAMGEPPFIAFLLATLLVCVVAITRRGGGRQGWRSALLAGLFLGLALGSKLTTIIAVVGIGCWGLWAAVGPALGARLARTSGSRLDVRPLGWALGVVGVALLVFVATNPFLYRDPVGRTLLMFQNRQHEMALQAEADPERAVTRLSESIDLVFRHSLLIDTWADSAGRWPLDAALAGVGLWWLLWRGVRWEPGPDSLLLLWVGGSFAGVSLGLGYVLDHYYVPTATLAVALSGVGVGRSAGWLWQAGVRLAGRRQLTANVARSVTGRAHPASTS